MVERCDEPEVTLMTAYRLQAEPAVRRTREVYRDVVIGELVQIHASFSSHVLEYGSPDQ